ncbi:MAG: hypothetical protein ABSA67_02240 [Candidatus Brocadiia bacterium]|jgi:hypothetical protein
MIGRRLLTIGALLLAATIAGGADEANPQPSSPYAPWKNGPSQDASFFPIGVFTQEPAYAPRYKSAGVNLYVGLWNGPTEAQLAELKKCGMQVVCDQNAVGLAHKNDPTIVGWLAGGVPDESVARPRGNGRRPPVPLAKVVQQYEALRKADPSRPEFISLSQAVAWDDWDGRGDRNNHPEDYPEYLKGCDIAFFEFFPAANSDPRVKGQLDFVARGVERLIRWGEGRKIVWNIIECTRVNWDTKATPRQVKAEVWMSLVHGSRGIIYFCHEFKPRSTDRALLNDPQMLAAVTAINKQVRELAPALNSATVQDTVKVECSNKDVPVATMVKKQGGATCVFAVAMKPGETEAAFTLDGLAAGAQVEVLGEDRKIEPADGKFRDQFRDWDVHLYRVR